MTRGSSWGVPALADELLRAASGHPAGSLPCPTICFFDTHTALSAACAGLQARRRGQLNSVFVAGAAAGRAPGGDVEDVYKVAAAVDAATGRGAHDARGLAARHLVPAPSVDCLSWALGLVLILVNMACCHPRLALRSRCCAASSGACVLAALAAESRLLKRHPSLPPPLNAGAGAGGDYDSEDELAGKKKDVEALAALEHDGIAYAEFNKDFYDEAPEVAAMTPAQVRPSGEPACVFGRELV